MPLSTRLEEYGNTLRQQVLPAYEPLGRLSLVYLLGSLASGYTEEADLDIMMVWDDANVPAASLREPLVSHFDERPGIPAFVVDYRDIHLERYVMAGQEYHVAHQTRVSFEAMLQVILDGKRDGTDRVLDPLVATAGFAYGELVWDREGLGRQWKNRLNTFPPVVKRECVRAVLAHRQAHLTDLTTLMKRADWFKFHCLLVEALRTSMRALFALHEVYYPGDKWLRQAILRFGLGEDVLTSFDRLFEATDSAGERAIEQLAALRRLMDLVEGDEAGQHFPLQEVQVRSIRSLEELRAAVTFAQRVFGLSERHRGGFFDYYASRFAQQSDLMVMAEANGEMVGIILGSIQGDHILVGEVAVAAAYQRQGIGSRLLALVERHARALGYQRFLLGTADAQDFYLKNGYVPLLWLHVEESGVGKLEQMLQTELGSYPLIWKPATWKQGDRHGIQLALQTPAPDEVLRRRIEKAVPACQGEYLFAKGYEAEASGYVSSGETPEISCQRAKAHQ
jgi:GNAT superfamily N-acetyltransferase